MKIVALMENTTCREDLQAEHGLSLYIEANGQKILFDSGASGSFADNAEALGIPLEAVDVAVLSHGHNDHSGGFLRFLGWNYKAPLWVRPEAMLPCHSSSGEYIGLDPALQKSERLQLAAHVQPIGEGLTLYSCHDKHSVAPLDSAGLTVYQNGQYLPDTFPHEQYLLIEEAGKRVLISGCSHKGILNIMHWFKPDVLVGGFHYMRVDPESTMLETWAKELLSYDCTYYTGHCTGLPQYDKMKKIMADRLHYLSTGMEIQI
ncbi:MAG: MBL fold metallo-hydrolase [Oscillospiraceae bacterium]|nr:MBL fold metallo-hydrolase [Oscillospiraceae bacterium]